MFYMLGFNYPGPRCNFPDDSEEGKAACNANWAAEDEVIQAAKKLGLEMRHAYSWPDGSLFKYLKSEKSREEIFALFLKELKTSVLYSVHLKCPESDVISASQDNLEKLFSIR